MADKVDIEKLALLARIKFDSKEEKKLKKEFEAILDYISKLKEVDAGGADDGVKLKNVMREDERGHKPGEFSDDLLREAPSVEKGYVKVKHIL